MLNSKTQRVGKEFQELKTKNGPLAQLILDLTDYVSLEFNKDVMMTMIFRTQQEQYDLYAKTDGPKTKRKSPHMFWNAVDIRDWIYNEKEKTAIGEFLKSNYDGTNQMAALPSGSKTYWLHQIKGQAMHFHIQYKGVLVYTFSEGEVITA